ncbi:23S rRNA (guanine(2445)-N(2))/(guanine(2069)-N(7))-methyltransferase [Syntrophotalea acetylenivorans]|uniref:Ribosomal RNA large subunit methyltransferase K/L n=1 Tax=Syntrophotalea acetylenivorans TaxID=1842532 RepID=A0A1L3GKP1_9BACT|nr:bifunctional 23S rRNA (guanine(2069)-N(7))-methyltransferase RlmK/23S rRNA (guanine(2445)-N(2))-methyltransferase RlmL [Syntrophotalea acetylenivorans]APG26470.1 23S rRNA (guanine(2445)-N(2))/(guanine(2069)-N(7))-methyltransferase [Syntrophotalea acetylenivorans]
MTQYELFAPAPKGLEPLLAEELRSLGAQNIAETRAGVAFSGDLKLAYRVCLWSRLASRVLLTVARFAAASPEQLYEEALLQPWEEHLAADGTLAVSCQVVRSQISHSRYAALKLKDAIVDRFRDRCGNRPSVDVERPDVRFNLHLDKDQATLSIDLSGESLHRRGYRTEGVLAPLKENLAAAILLRAGWPQIAAKGGSLLDPVCGSGTLLIEGALIAADIAPGLNRPYFGFEGWKGHQPDIWRELLLEARERRKVGLAQLPMIAGRDRDSKAVRAAHLNADRAGLGGQLHFSTADLADLRPPDNMEDRPGLLIANPPYGERLGERDELVHLYGRLGENLRRYFLGWKASVFTGNPDLAKELAIRARRKHNLYNGALQCQLLHFDINERWFFGAQKDQRPAKPAAPLSEGAQMFANRIKKNLRQVARWAKKNDISCYRLYDADMPEYAVAVDLYGPWVHVQEYQAPDTIDATMAQRRLKEAMAALPEALDVTPEQIFLKVRSRQSGRSQYRKLQEEGQFHEVTEGNCRFLVNFTDYLDTGLFLDHRPTRLLVQQMAAGKRFLNLFAYTGSATVHALKGGASSTLTVDMSRTYLEWAQRNLALNGFQLDENHRLLQADCLAWLEQAEGSFDLIFLDPPSFSNSKSMTGTFDVQRDHVALLRQAVALLAEGGVLLFSNNLRRFKLDREVLADLEIEDLTAATIPKDFARNSRIHNCWRIKARNT